MSDKINIEYYYDGKPYDVFTFGVPKDYVDSMDSQIQEKYKPLLGKINAANGSLKVSIDKNTAELPKFEAKVNIEPVGFDDDMFN